jgi:hypothetical protein
VALSILEPEGALVNLGEASASQVVMVAERCAPSDAIAEKAVVRPKELALEVPGVAVGIDVISGRDNESERVVSPPFAHALSNAALIGAAIAVVAHGHEPQLAPGIHDSALGSVRLRLAIRICGLDDLSRRATSHENGNEARADSGARPAVSMVSLADVTSAALVRLAPKAAEHEVRLELPEMT